MKAYKNGIVELVKTPSSSKKWVNIDVDGTEVFVPHGSVVVEKWYEIEEKVKLNKIWATKKANDGNIWTVKDKIWEDSRLITGNDSFDHFLEFENLSTKEVRYAGTTVGNPLHAYYPVSKDRAFLEAD